MTAIIKFFAVPAFGLMLTAAHAQSPQLMEMCERIEGLNPEIIDDVIEARCLSIDSAGNVTALSDGNVGIDFDQTEGGGAGSNSDVVVSTQVGGNGSDTAAALAGADATLDDGLGVSATSGTAGLVDVNAAGTNAASGEGQNSSVLDVNALNGGGEDSGNELVDVDVGSSSGDSGNDTVSVDVMTEDTSAGSASQSNATSGSIAEVSASIGN